MEEVDQGGEDTPQILSWEPGKIKAQSWEIQFVRLEYGVGLLSWWEIRVKEWAEVTSQRALCALLRFDFTRRAVGGGL